MFRLALVVMFVLALVHPSAGLEWRQFGDPDLGFRVSLPVDLFTDRTVKGSSLHFSDSTGDVVLDLYGAKNAERLPPTTVADQLALSDRIDEVTYRRHGRSWFVLSGYYAREGYEPHDLVFYTKFMFSSDRARFTAFEISYPAAMKDELDHVVERIEDTFRPLF